MGAVPIILLIVQILVGLANLLYALAPPFEPTNILNLLMALVLFWQAKLNWSSM